MTSQQKASTLLASLGIENPSEEQVNIVIGFIEKIERDKFHDGFQAGQNAMSNALSIVNSLI